MLYKRVPRVLCVDDDEDACELLGMLMKPYGIDATCVQSAAEAWLKIKAECFDLYVLDAWLPDLDGYEICRQIRAYDADTPILFYSGAAYESDKKKATAAGATAYVSKPDVERLIAKIVELVAKARTKDVSNAWLSKQLGPVRKSLSARLFSVNTAAD